MQRWLTTALLFHSFSAPKCCQKQHVRLDLMASYIVGSICLKTPRAPELYHMDTSSGVDVQTSNLQKHAAVLWLLCD